MRESTLAEESKAGAEVAKLNVKKKCYENKEIKTEKLEKLCKLIFELKLKDFIIIKNKLLEIDKNPTIALKKVLGL